MEHINTTKKDNTWPRIKELAKKCKITPCKNFEALVVAFDEDGKQYDVEKILKVIRDKCYGGTWLEQDS